jgi:hypothetical protein
VRVNYEPLEWQDAIIEMDMWATMGGGKSTVTANFMLDMTRT